MNYINTCTKRSRIKTILLGASLLFLAGTIITFPEVSFNASLKGLKIWWETVFPALLPFLILAEILLSTGIIHFIGVLLEPIMRPLFNVPGVGSFVLAMGFASGYPMASKLTANFREQKLVTRIEGERLVAFATTSDPLFLFGAIAVGFFHDAKLGVILALIHYVSSIGVGLIMRFYCKNDSEQPNNITEEKNSSSLIRAFKAMDAVRSKDNRKFGKIMGDSVMSSVEVLVMVGGFIILFSVFLAILNQLQLTLFLTKIISIILLPIGVAPELVNSMINGLFEVTLGAKSISEASSAIPFQHKLAILCAISAWSGISVHAQVAAIVQKTDMRYLPFLFAKIIHMVIAFVLAIITCNIFKINYLSDDIPTFLSDIPNQFANFSILDTILYLIVISLSLLVILLILSIIIRMYKKIKSL